MQSLQRGMKHSIGVFFNLFLLFLFYSAAAQETGRLNSPKSERTDVFFVNFSPTDIDIYWIDHRNGMPQPIGTVPPYSSIRRDSFIGHFFAIHQDGMQKRKVEIEEKDAVFIEGLEGVEEVPVKCSTTGGEINAHIKPLWSPMGAARFLKLVSIGYFDGCGLNRVVPEFLTQFGISADYKMRTDWRMENIPDDKPQGITFKEGYMSYAGSGPNSRSTEVFIVMPGTAERQLNYFGVNSWETPFGYVDMDDVKNVVGKWHSYGDMAPWGHGPDPQHIYREDGYEYLKTEFPELSYIETCRIVTVDEEEEEL